MKKMANVFLEDGKTTMLFKPHSFLDLDSVYIRRKVTETFTSHTYVIIIMECEILIVNAESSGIKVLRFTGKDGEILKEELNMTYDDVIDLINENSKKGYVLCSCTNEIFEIVKFQVATSQVVNSEFNTLFASKLLCHSPNEFERMTAIDQCIALIKE